LNLSFPQKVSGLTAAKLTKLTGAESKLLFKRFAKGGVGIVPGCQGNLRDVYSAHPQFAPGPLQAQTPHIAGSALADMGGEDTMEVGHRKARDRGQHFPVEGFVDVLTDVSHHIFNALGSLSKGWDVSQHIQRIVYQNTCSLLQTYHAGNTFQNLMINQE
jgi:hypothetical protein